METNLIAWSKMVVKILNVDFKLLGFEVALVNASFM